MTAAMSVEAFQDLVEESYLINEKLDLIETEEIKPLKRRVAEIDRIILAQLDAMGVNAFKSRRGTVSRRRMYAVTTPKSRDEKQALFNWLESKGPDVFYRYVGVNSTSLNALYKEQMEIAKEEGDLDFSIPGVGEPKLQEKITRRNK